MAERRNSVSCNRLGAFDRFIPYRPNLDVDASYARLQSCSTDTMENEPAQYKSPNSKTYWKLLSNAVQNRDGKILPLTSRSPKTTKPFSCNTGNFLSPSPDEGYSSPSVERRRRIPTSPDCIMDMPGLRDDFYTNLLDWSSRNLIAVALFQSAYVWNTDSKECQRIEIHFSELETSRFYISAICWNPRDKLLAISDNEGEIVICDVEQMKSQRKFINAADKKRSIGSLLWTTDFGIISGNRKGTITLHDHRCEDNKSVVNLSGHHSKEVCGLRLAPGSSYLASGGDDGLVNIWDLRMSQCYRTIHAHTACTKALSWCPWKQSVIATGGGSSDGHIRLWNIHTGERLGETFTKSQICGLLWSKEYSELISAHGTATPDKNDLILWNMKQLEFEPTAKLRHHMARPLHVALSPDETTVASAGADESLCLWKTFPKKQHNQKSVWDSSPLNMFKTIR